MEKTTTIIKPPSAVSFDFKELWQHRELLYFFTWRDIKVKYKQTVLGILWALLQPLALMLLFTLIFSRTSIASTQTHLAYPVYVLSGLILWNLFYTSVSHAADSMIVNAGIIKKIYFPRLIIPVATIMAALIDFAVSFVLFLALLLIYKQPLSWMALFCFPAAILLCVFTAFGLGTLLGAFNVKFRDFKYALPFLLQLLFFGTQIIYSFDVISNQWIKYAVALNPMNAVVEIFRAGFGEAADLSIIVIGTGCALLLTIWGLVYFKKAEVYFADIA